MAHRPIPSSQQQLVTLAEAARAPSPSTEIRHALTDGRVTLEVLFSRADDGGVGQLTVLDALTALPGSGNVQATKLLTEVEIPTSRRLCDIDVHRRWSLLGELLVRPEWKRYVEVVPSASLLEAVEEIGRRVRPDLTDDQLEAEGRGIATALAVMAAETPDVEATA